MQSVLNHLGQPVGVSLGEWQPPEAPGRETMEGRFCCVEALAAESHARQLYEANSVDAEGRGWTYLPYGPFANFEEYHAWLSQIERGKDPLFFAIRNKSTGRVLGLASYLRIDPSHGTIEVGHIHFSPLLQGTPAATEAMYLMMERAFAGGFRRYEWKCDALNAASCSAARRLGFTFEGLFRQAVVVKGRNRDTAWFSIIDEEWPALRETFQTWLGPSNFDENGRQKVSLSALTADLIGEAKVSHQTP